LLVFLFRLSFFVGVSDLYFDLELDLDEEDLDDLRRDDFFLCPPTERDLERRSLSLSRARSLSRLLFFDFFEIGDLDLDLDRLDFDEIVDDDDERRADDSVDELRRLPLLLRRLRLLRECDRFLE
jgi:hypothetical protein